MKLGTLPIAGTLATALLLAGHGLAGAQGVTPGGGSQPGGAAAGATTPGMPGQGGTGMTGATTGQLGSTQPGTGQAGQAMGESQIRTALQTRGYSDLEGLRRDGDSFRVREAKRYGEKVEDLRIDASTGQVRDEARLSEDQAKRLLRDQGYSDVSDVSRDGDTITAKAKRGDREMRVSINARSGAVTQQSASN